MTFTIDEYIEAVKKGHQYNKSTLEMLLEIREQMEDSENCICEDCHRVEDLVEEMDSIEEESRVIKAIIKEIKEKLDEF